MKIRHVLPVRFVALICYYSILCFNNETLASSQFAFIQSSTRNQDQSPNQQTLPPEKKKTLPNLGPDELFPGDREEPAPANQRTRSPKRQRLTPKSSTATITAPESASTAISPNPPPTLSQRELNQLPTTQAQGTFESQGSPTLPSTWQMPFLGSLSVVVFFGLLYVLSK